FFKELSFIAIIAMIFSILIQLLLSFLTGGYLLDMNIKITAVNLIGAIIVTLISTLVTTIPFLIYLMKISPVEMLREE
ncbi:MAG: hypothetical protein ACRDDY_18635, partial [Clostridium sp.]|uniref:hypothetical protein n=1 Tax=Clostridium sp. TaxID=1506 RepID=UPI003EE7FE9F